MRFVFIILLFLGAAEAKRGAGPYIGGGYGTSVLKDNGYYSDLEKNKSNGYLLYAGAYINDYLSVELEYIDGLNYERQNGETITHKFIDINTQAHYPFLEKRIDLFAKFGAGFVYQNSSGHTLVYGAGAAYRIDERYALRMGYNYFDFGIDNSGDGAVDKNMAVGYLFASFEVQF